MKLLNHPSIEPKKELLERLKSWKGDEDELKKILSGYEINRIDSKVAASLPEFVKVGEVIHVTREESSWDYIGNVAGVWYRNTEYTPQEVMSTFSNVTFGNVSCFHLTVYEETRPKIYDRIVLNTNEKGIIIIPCINGIKIEKVEDK